MTPTQTRRQFVMTGATRTKNSLRTRLAYGPGALAATNPQISATGETWG